MGMKSRKRMEEEKKQNKKNYIGLKHSMKTMTTTNNNDTIFGIILLKIRHSNYKL